MNISVPDDLKKKMDKVKGVNWSALACQAFIKELAELAAKKQEKSMDDVLARLRGSKVESDEESFKLGKEAGEHWAKHEATVKQLKRIDKRRDPVNDWFFGVGSSAYSSAEQFYFMIEPSDDGMRDEASEFWIRVLGEEQELDDDFVQGFAMGAMDVWNDVKDKL